MLDPRDVSTAEALPSVDSAPGFSPSCTSRRKWGVILCAMKKWFMKTIKTITICKELDRIDSKAACVLGVAV